MGMARDTKQENSPSRSGSNSRRRRSGGRRRRTAAATALPLLVLRDAAGAIGPDLPPQYQVVHANVVFRHGERTRLLKTTADEFGVNDGVTLTNKGEQDCYNLGAQLRERYMPTNTTASARVTTTIPGLTPWYDADRVQVESTGYDRTLESATAMAMGLYPAGQTDRDVAGETLLQDNMIVVPVHSREHWNDPYLLGFEMCPVYDDNWQESYRETDFLDLEKQATDPQGANGEKEGYVNQVYTNFQSWVGRTTPACMDEAKALYDFQLKLHAPYNLWDCARSTFLAGDSTAVDIIMLAELPPEGLAHFGLDENRVYQDKGFQYLQYLVYKIEDMKYEQRMVGRLAGGLYLTSMHQRMKEVRAHYQFGEANTAGRFPGMQISAAHYGTLKGIAGALDLGGLEGIPDYASHLTFELLRNAEAAADGEDDFAVRILYQSGTNVAGLDFVSMSPVFDASGSQSITDHVLAETRDEEYGIMPWVQWEYLMEIQVAGTPAIYTSDEPEVEWCYDCQATEPNVCLRTELQYVAQQWDEAQAALGDVSPSSDGSVGGGSVAALSIFGVILGIGMGICIKPCLDKRQNKLGKKKSGAVAGNRGLEAWGGSGSNGTVTGTFRLGAKQTSRRHEMGAVDSSQMVPVAQHDFDDENVHGEAPYNGRYHDDEENGPSIPSFAPTSTLGEPVPFPHRREGSALMSGTADHTMRGTDDDDDDDDNMGNPSARELLVLD